MSLRGAVEIEAYDFENKLALRQVFSIQEWYEELHPIVDSDDERVRLRISKLQGKQYNDDGDLEQFWSNTYTESGTLAKMRVWRKDGSTEQTNFSK